MKGDIIALEEHFTLSDKPFGPQDEIGLKRISYRHRHDPVAEMMDIGESRIRHMDDAGVTMQILSCGDLQRMPAESAVPHAIAVNDAAHAAMLRYPGRFSALASLPTDDPRAAIAELERCHGALGFKGAFIAGPTGGQYLDDKRFWPILECAASLAMPVYLHPSDPHPLFKEAHLKNYPELVTAAWGYGVEAASHFLRMTGAGVFDAVPDLKIILGHYGEAIPFWLDRTNTRTAFDYERRGLRKHFRDYVDAHLWVTTSGHFSLHAFHCAVSALGIDKIMFAVDWPHEHSSDGIAYLQSLPISEADREKIANGNVRTLMGL